MADFIPDSDAELVAWLTDPVTDANANIVLQSEPEPWSEIVSVTIGV